MSPAAEAAARYLRCQSELSAIVATLYADLRVCQRRLHPETPARPAATATRRRLLAALTHHAA